MPSKIASSQPFIYGRALQPYEFLNREYELGTIFDRIRLGESSAIVGEHKIGKTSLLLKLADEETQKQYLGADAHKVMIYSLDLQPFGQNDGPIDFWREILEFLQRRPGHVSTSSQIEQTVQAGYTRYSLQQLFDHLNQQGRRLVLLLDEFKRLLNHPNFQDPGFFALLRSLSTSTGGLVVIPASSLSVTGMNMANRRFKEIGSPPFNHMIDVLLHPFDITTADALLDRAETAFTPEDRLCIYRVAGGHPFLIQAMAAALFETAGSNRYTCAAQCFYERVSAYFDVLWRQLDDQARDTVFVLGLMELSNCVLGQSISVDEQVNVLGAHLQNLFKLGLARPADQDWPNRECLCSLDKHLWVVRPQALVWWIHNVIIRSSGAVPVDIVQEQASPEQKSRLHQILVKHFDVEELDLLCFDLDIEFGGLPGKSKKGKTKELITHLERRGQITQLIRVGKQKRPDVSWELVETSASKSPTSCKWVSDEHYQRMWSEEQWSRLVNAAREAPEWTPYGTTRGNR